MNTEEESKSPFLVVVENDAHLIDHLSGHIPVMRHHPHPPPPYTPRGGDPHHHQ